MTSDHELNACTRRCGRVAAVVAMAALLWGLPACGVRVDESGIRAAVLYELLAPSEPIATDMGDLVTIEAAELRVRSVELMRCREEPLRDVGDADDGSDGDDRSAFLHWSMLSTARAHTEDTPTRLGVPVTVEVEGGGPASPGVLRPPPGEYCGIRLMLGASDEAPRDSAARIAGRYLAGETMVDFVRSTPLTNTVEIDMPRLVLDSARDAVEIWLTADSARWLDSMALTEVSSDDRVLLAEQVAASIDVQVRWTAGTVR